MADDSYVVSYKVDMDEMNQSRFQQALEKNDELAKSIAESFEQAVDSLKNFREKFASELPSVFGGQNSAGIEGASSNGLVLKLDTSKAEQSFSDFAKKISEPIELNADASGITSAAQSALESVKAMFSQTFTINAQANIDYEYNYPDEDEEADDSESSGSTFLSMSSGGRFSSPTYVQVAEDGDDEYIIPVRKENKAIPLLKQLINELSPDARKTLNIGSKMDSSVSPAVTMMRNASVSDLGGTSVSNVQNNNNVSSPVTINVNSSGANADRIGESIYNTAERYLLRTLKGVFA